MLIPFGSWCTVSNQFFLGLHTFVSWLSSYMIPSLQPVLVVCHHPRVVHAQAISVFFPWQQRLTFSDLFALLATANFVETVLPRKGQETFYSATYMSQDSRPAALLKSRKWQLTGMSQWCCSALCGHPLPALTDNWTHHAASRHTIAQSATLGLHPVAVAATHFPSHWG